MFCLDLVDSIVEVAFSNPESPVETEEERREEEDRRARDRVACSASFVHQVTSQHKVQSFG